MALFRFQTASKLTGVFFVLFSLALLVFSPAWVRQYIAAENQWPVATDIFRLVAASDLMVGVLLIGLASSHLEAKSQCWLSLGMATSTAILTGVHVLILATRSEPPLWQPMLYFDTALFCLLAFYWVGVTMFSARAEARLRTAAHVEA